MEYETDAKNVSYVRLTGPEAANDGISSGPGFGSDDEIIDMFGGDSEALSLTLDKDVHKNAEDSRVEEALKDIYERLRPG